MNTDDIDGLERTGVTPRLSIEVAVRGPGDAPLVRGGAIGVERGVDLSQHTGYRNSVLVCRRLRSKRPGRHQHMIQHAQLTTIPEMKLRARLKRMQCQRQISTLIQSS